MGTMNLQIYGLLGFMFAELGRYSYFVAETARHLFFRKFYFINLIDEMNTIGSRSLVALAPV